MEANVTSERAGHPLFPRTLPDGWFRLLQWVEGSGNLSFKLIEVAIEQAPPYNALSYRWQDPDPEKNTRLTCNDIEISVGPNLYEALLRVRKLQERCEYIWVDCLCIDQHNQIQKQRQMLMMPQVYRTAKVIIWLGPDSHQKTWNFFLWIIEIFRAVDEERETPDQRQSYDQLLFILDHTPHAKFEEIWQLFQQDWFARVWTLQEAALSSDAIVLNGDTLFPYPLLVSFTTKYVKGDSHWVKLVSAIRPVSAGNDPKNPPRPFILHLKAVLKIRAGSNATRMLDYLRPLECTDPRDRIFSLAAFLSPKLIQQLRGLVTTKEVYQLFAAIDPSIDCLAAAGLCQQNLNLPSWVPDWTYRKTNEPLWTLDVDAFESRGQRLFQASREEADMVINDEAFVKGIIFDTIISHGEPYHAIQLPAGFDVHTNPQLLLDLLESEKQQIDKYIELSSPYAPLIEIRRTLIGNMIPETLTETYAGVWIKATSEQVDDVFVDFEDQIQDIREYCERRTSKDRPIRPNGLLCIATMCKGRTLFVTDRGWIGMGPAILTKGDKVCIFNGARTPSVIRPVALNSTDKSKHQLVGECYVHGLMDGEISNMPELHHEAICLV